MLSIACVYHRGGGGFSDEYVYRLRDDVARYCKEPHRFVCFSNERLPGIERLPLIHNYPKYWAKIELFRYRPWFFDGPILYFDLDVILCGDITEIARYPHQFSAIAQFSNRARSRFSFCSAVMAWMPSEEIEERVYKPFGSHLIPHYDHADKLPGRPPWIGIGDEAYIGEQMPSWTNLIATFPGQFAGRGTGLLDPRTAVYICAGHPRPHRFGWRVPARKAAV